jgi:hypothetical protein
MGLLTIKGAVTRAVAKTMPGQIHRVLKPMQAKRGKRRRLLSPKEGTRSSII